MAVLTVLLAAAAATAPLDDVPHTWLDAELRCLLGAYSLPGGKTVTITGIDGQPRGLQYTLSDGRFGSLQEKAGGWQAVGDLRFDFGSCKAGTMTLTKGKVVQRGAHLRLIERAANFTSDGIALHGKLVLPPGGRAGTVAVWIEGSNNDPSTDDSIWQYELARRGVAVLVYDKRGTGSSAGALTSDFNARARDTAAAVKLARRMVPGARQVGVIGGSQGGWVAPLTAKLTDLDFVIAAFAMAEGPIAQDRELVEQQLRQAGAKDADLAAARQLTTITERIVRSNMREGLAELEAFKASHADAPWLSAIQPRSYTGLFLLFGSDQIRTDGPALAQGLSFDYDPKPVIEAIRPPQLWLLGGSDSQAPNTGTQAILRQLQASKRDIAVVIFPQAEHGLVEPVPEEQGSGMTYSANLFDITANWIKTRRLPKSGRQQVLPPIRH